MVLGQKAKQLKPMMLWSIFSTASGGWLWTVMTWCQYLYLGDSLIEKHFVKDACQSIFYKMYVKSFAKYDERWPSVLWMQRGESYCSKASPASSGVLWRPAPCCWFHWILLDPSPIISVCYRLNFVPHERNAKALSPSTSECELIWKQGHCKCN